MADASAPNGATDGPYVHIDRLRVRYGSTTAIDGLSLEIGRGELFVLLGGSGSGKTTLLRTLGGFITPDAGRIILAGQDITARPPHRRPVNTMFQSYALFPHMSVAENVGFGLRRQGVAKAEIAARVSELLDLVKLGAFAARKPDALSGGQRQRVALARSLAPRPDLLLLDEPLSALDESLREQTRAELLALQRRLGTTFMLVTHDQDEALSMATRIGLMHEGRLAQVATPAEIYNAPRSRFVAEFIGGANILPATVRSSGEQGTLVDLTGLGTALVSPQGRGAVGQAVSLVLRPSRLKLSAGMRPAAPNRLPGRVVSATYHGDRVDHGIRLSDGTLIRAAEDSSDGRITTFAEGEGVMVTWAPSAGILVIE